VSIKDLLEASVHGRSVLVTRQGFGIGSIGVSAPAVPWASCGDLVEATFVNDEHIWP